jgi:hypothetical protein
VSAIAGLRDGATLAVRAAMIRIVIAVLLLGGVARADDELDARWEQARLLEKNQQYVEALKELDAAYAIRQPPLLLYDLARIHQLLGHAKEALTYYERYLAADFTLPPERRAELWAQITELRRLTAPPPTATVSLPPGMQLAPVKLELHHDRGLMGGGLTLLLTGYAAAFVTGATLAGLSANDSYDRSLYYGSGTLLIPVAGPFISALVYPQAVWSLPWVLIDGTAQVAGLVMTIIGSKRTHKVPVIAPMATAGGGGFAVSGRF